MKLFKRLFLVLVLSLMSGVSFVLFKSHLKSRIRFKHPSADLGRTQAERILATKIDINQKIKQIWSMKGRLNWTSALGETHRDFGRKTAVIKQSIGRKANPMAHMLEGFGYSIEDTIFNKKYTGPSWDVFFSNARNERFGRLNPHQLVATLPGLAPIIIKVLLSASKPPLSCMKQAFILPKEKKQLLEYTEKHPNVQWLRKGRSHRGIELVNIIEDMKKAANFFFTSDLRHFYQEFISDPLLIENRKFDIGVHAVFTSANPLRYYVDFGEWNIKFCNKEYHPFDSRDLRKYVEADNVHRSIKVKSIGQHVLREGLTKKEALQRYLSSAGHNVTMLEDKIMEAFVEIGGVKDAEILNAITAWKKIQNLTDYKNRNYFEFTRFDIVLDSKLNPWIIEVNASPDMGSFASTNIPAFIADLKSIYSAEDLRHLTPEKIDFINLFGRKLVLQSMLVLSGVAQLQSGVDETKLVEDDVINVDSDVCQTACKCDQWECAACSRCLDDEDKLEMRRSVMEHYRQGHYRRAHPRPFKHQDEASKWRPESDKYYHKLTKRSKISFLWFRLKCLQQSLWCQ